MKNKIIMCSLAIVFIIYTVAVGTITYRYGKKVPRPTTEDVLLENTQILESDNKDELIEKQANMIALLNKRLLEEHNEINYQPTTNQPIPQVDEYIPFVPDFLPELPEIDELRIAITNYNWIDTTNDYRVSFEILYSYKTRNFKVTPEKLLFDAHKPKQFCISAVANTNSYGLLLQWDFLKFFRLSSGAYLDNEIKPIIGLGLGFRW